MKYQNLPAFEKHLDQAVKIQLSRVFLVVSPCPYERKKIVQKIIAVIRSKEGEINYQIQEGTQGSIDRIIEGLNTTSLLAGKQILYLDSIDKIKKAALVPLIGYVCKPSPFSYLILGANSSKGLADLYTKGKKELIACDLSDEKPWDRKDRLKRMLADYSLKAGKTLHPAAIEHLLENIGLDCLSLEQEVDKLITFIGERRELTVQDVDLLCATKKSPTLWQLADTIAWGESFPKLEENIDLKLLLPLLSQLRTQFQNGMALAILLERGAAHVDIAHQIPNLKPVSLDKMLSLARVRRSPFFKRALGFVFETELMSKNSSFDPALILDLLLAKLTMLKSYVVPSSKSPSR